MSHQPESAADFWERAYKGRDRVDHGDPNPILVEAVRGLEPGTALDLACGEGWDSIWLAENGWRVTAADISHEAIARLTGVAQERGLSGRVTAERHDFEQSLPGGEYSLVSVMFMQSPVPFARAETLRRAAALVAPGGSLVVASHAEPHPWAGGNYPATLFPTPESELADLEPVTAGWTVVAAEPVPHHMVNPQGQPVTRMNNVVHLRRPA